MTENIIVDMYDYENVENNNENLNFVHFRKRKKNYNEVINFVVM